MNTTKEKFIADLLTWFSSHKRDLPWRKNKNPYHILISETMLQQTQVATVIPYFENFITLFPTPEILAVAEQDALMSAWAGLGYYSRARNLQASAQMITALGHFPDTHEEILKLKGVGPYTAGAIASIAFALPTPAVDGNVFRVISRLFCIAEDITKPKTRLLFEQTVSDLIPHDKPGDFNEALMELGATTCLTKNPTCNICPVRVSCLAYARGQILDFPVKSKLKTKQVIKQLVILIENENGEFLISQRPDTGLLANFYEFIQIENKQEKDTLDLLTEIFDFDHREDMLKHQEFIGRFEHVFTHRVWEIDAFYIKISHLDYLKPGSFWVAKKELRKFALSTIHLKIFDQWNGQLTLGL